jgi:hypothetical protein
VEAKDGGEVVDKFFFRVPTDFIGKSPDVLINEFFWQVMK